MQKPVTKDDGWASILDALMDAAAAILTANSLQETLHSVAVQLQGLVPFEDLAIYEVDRGANLFVPLFAHGTFTDEVMAFSFPLEQGIFICIVAFALVVNLLADVVQVVLDPRLR